MARSSVLRDYTVTSILMATTHPNMRYQSHRSVLIAVVEILLPFLNWSALFCGILISAQYLYWAAKAHWSESDGDHKQRSIPVWTTVHPERRQCGHGDLLCPSLLPRSQWLDKFNTNHEVDRLTTQPSDGMVFNAGIHSIIHSSQEHLYTVYNMDCTSGVATREWVGPGPPYLCSNPSWY